jgi:hypothetical protein
MHVRNVHAFFQALMPQDPHGYCAIHLKSDAFYSNYTIAAAMKKARIAGFLIKRC